MRFNPNWVDTVRLANRKISNLDGNFQEIETTHARLRVLDTGGHLPPVLMTPDGPNVIEHHLPVINELKQYARVICFDMPGFGYSFPKSTYGFAVDDGADTVLELLDILKIETAILAFTCANGFYALAAAKKAPDRVRHLVLSQTPSVDAMRNWTDVNVPGPLRWAGIGQLIMALTEQRFANIWYKYALPRDTAREPYQDIALDALRGGGCFCLAGMAQGLNTITREHFAGIETPTIGLWGKKDYSHRGTDKNSLETLLPHAQLHTYTCGHFPDIEQSQEFIQHIRAVL